MTEFDGDASRLDYLRYDVTNLAHYIRPNARVLVVGSGGGRDVLAALYFQQPEIVAVEVNEAVLETVNGRYGPFTGHLDRQPGVTFVHDEARSYIARTDKTFDIIHVPLLDTWAATAAGAYALTENPMYTTEAWQRMLRRLSDQGVVTFSRWYAVEAPGQLYRLTSLAVASLTELGVTNPADHLIIVCRPHDPSETPSQGIATLLASRTPFSSRDLDTIERVAEEMAFEVLLSPRGASNETLRQLTSGDDFEAFTRGYPMDITPPTDDRPYFFDMIRLRDVLSFLKQPRGETPVANLSAVATLGILLLTSLALTGLCVVVPLGLTIKRATLTGWLPFFVYFGSIGLGFMLVEIALMQRLSVLLGHPIYSMAVVLFGLLLATGGGSWLSGVVVKDASQGSRGPACLAALVGVVLLVGWVVVPRLSQFDAAPIAARLALACGLLLPLGLTMGTAFPLGMRAADRHGAGLTPWLFGINGAASICGSVLAVVISLCFGIAAVLLAAVACYLIALLAFVWTRLHATAKLR